jgi:hypothetical protein
MSNQVYANNMEVSCKAAAGKSICAFPDVCMTPPQTPATPPGVPIPYPNTGMASDTSDGSTSVKISRQEVMLKNKSCFKKSTGDEAGAAPMKGVVTHKNMGKVYFTAWSMDVKVEGENVVRMLDMTTHNHGSVPGNTPPWPYVDEVAMPGITEACKDDVKKEQDACKDVEDPCKHFNAKPPSGEGSTRELVKPVADKMSDHIACNECLNARRCKLSPWESAKNADGETVRPTCCGGQTPHHIVEKSAFGEKEATVLLEGASAYNPKLAPCVCAEGTGHSKGGTHELMHVFQKADTLAAINGKPKETLKLHNGGSTGPVATTTYAQARETGVKAFKKVFDDAGCSEDCIRKQLDAYHKTQCGIQDDTKLKAVTEGPSPKTMSVQEAEKELAERSWERWVSTGPQGAD